MKFFLYKSILLSFFLFLIYSCNFGSDKSTEDNTPIIRATSKKINHNEFLGNPITIKYLNNSLIVFDSQSEKIFKCINLKNSNVISFGDKGRGPNDIMMPKFSVDKKNNLIKVYCSQLNKLLYFNIKEISQNNTTPIFYKKFDKVNNNVLFDLDMKDGFYISRVYNSKESHPFVMFDDNFNKIGSGGEYPKLEKYDKLTKLSKAMLFQGKIASNVSKGRILFFYSNCDGYEIVNFKDGVVNTAKNELITNPLFKVKDKFGNVSYEKKNTFGYLAVDYTENFVYALYSGKSMYSEKGNASNVLHGDLIRIYNWDGELVKSIKLDKEINTLCCKNDQIFYGSNTKMEPSIFEFTIK